MPLPGDDPVGIVNTSIVGVSDVEWEQTLAVGSARRTPESSHVTPSLSSISRRLALIWPRSQVKMDDDNEGRSLVGVLTMVGGKSRLIFQHSSVR